MTFDIAIVGYGPVGQLLANLLGDRGYSVVVVERHEATYMMPRVAHFDHEIARMLQGLGIRPDATSYIEPYDDWYQWRDTKGDVLLQLDWRGSGPSGWNTANFFSQQDLERDMDARARACPTVSVRFGHRATSVEQDAAGVTLTVQPADAGGADRAEEIRSRYLIGCDGAKSLVRTLAGIEQVDLGFHYDWLILDVIPGESVDYDSSAWQLCDPRRPTTLVPGGPGRRRWEFMALPGEDINTLNSTPTAWQLLKPWGVTPTNSTLERHAVYQFQARWAKDWRKDRVLLAGDAAHVMPPFLGQGMCSGLRDAYNLAWKLDLVLEGDAGEGLLDTYRSERLPHVQYYIDGSIEVGRVICVTDEQDAAARDAQLKSEAAGTELRAPLPLPPTLGPGVLAKGDPAAGLLSVQSRVSYQGRVGLFDDLVGRGWIVLSSAYSTPELPDSLAALVRVLDLKVLTVAGRAGEGVDVVDVDGRYLPWLEQLGADTVVIRPDFYLYAAVAGGQLAQTLIELQTQLELTALAGAAAVV